MTGLVRRGVVAVAVAASALGTVVSTASSASAADGEKPEPGLPFLSCVSRPPVPDNTNMSDPCATEDNGQYLTNWQSWYNFSQVGRVGAVKSQQWSRVPLSMVAGNALFYSTFDLPTADDDVPEGTKVGNEQTYLVRAFLVSPEGSPREYGLSAPITVKTVAFGAVPAEVTLQVSQATDADGLPEPLQATAQHWEQKPPPNTPGSSSVTHLEPTVLRGTVSVDVKKIVVDGVDTHMVDGCGTGQTARLEVASDEINYRGRNNEDPGLLDTVYNPNVAASEHRDGSVKNQQFGLYGGTMEGSIDIPAFRNCRTALGDDLSPLLTSLISSADNPLSVRVGAIGGCLRFDDPDRYLPPKPGTNDPRDPSSGCMPGPYPPNKKITTVPKLLKLIPFAGPVRSYD